MAYNRRECRLALSETLPLPTLRPFPARPGRMLLVRPALAGLALAVGVISAGCTARPTAATLPASVSGAPVTPSEATAPARPTPVPASTRSRAGATGASDAVALTLARAPVERQRLDVVRALPHDALAFTQGLVMLDDETLLESTGLYGQSSLREVDLETGRVRRSRDLPPDLFGEGLALVGDRILQLTWREELALEYRAADLLMLDSVRYEGEGWGLCYDGARLVMSDGSSSLTFRRPDDFAATGSVTVTVGGAPVDRLNELECVGDAVYANVWQTDYIVHIDPADGVVKAVVDASGLLDPAQAAGADVLNGIAYRAATGTFLITGKLWPRLFEVRMVAAPAS